MASFSRIPLLRYSSLSSPLLFTNFSSPIFSPRCVSVSSSSSSSSAQDSSHSTDQFPPFETLKRTWKPMCLYYTQAKCTMMDDPFHMSKFNHSCSVPLEENISKTEKLRAQEVDYFLVLDLEGKVEIIEFPVLLMDAKTMHVVDLFHRFVRPLKLSDQKMEKYIESKYGGRLGIDRVWHDTAIPFNEVVQEFEAWLCGHNLWEKELGGPLIRAAFITCGNWDIKTKIPQQCEVCSMDVPPYFKEWINVKDIHLNFYNRRASGMKTMLRELNIPLLGSHHLGIDDTKNIASVVQRMLADGALMQITAKRKPGRTEYLFENRIR